MGSKEEKEEMRESARACPFTRPSAVCVQAIASPAVLAEWPQIML